ncbi:AAA family ATPase [Mesorhizobium sp.]|uniref:AAA family ATPase n=1 Tax=Mesorhizobium sp. TaxID=1871066 RepID=UPI001215531D|nr:AAA family ATPase [Mesorhizobium sp.]TJV16551.1 MAG: AAA family ATPase [Mesorhizobium sp.]
MSKAPSRAQAADWDAIRFHAGQLFTPSSPMKVAELFAGRRAEIAQLVEAVSERGRHAILYGEPGVGKTSTANILQHFIPATPHKVHYIRHPVVSSDTYSSIWMEIFRKIQFEVVEDGVPTKYNISELYAEGVTQNDVIRELSTFGEDAIPIIVIDEYQQFKDETGAAYLSETIKGISDSGSNVTIIVVGVGDSVDDLVKGHKSIIRCSEEVLMPRMNNDEMQKLFDVRVAQLGMKLEGNAKWKMISLSKGLPFFAHALGKSAVYSATARRSLVITESDVDKAIADTINSSKQTLKTTYEDATNSNQERAKFRHLITACALTKTDASGWFTPKDVENPLSRIVGLARRVDHFNANLKDFASAKRGNILQMKGTERAYRFRFTDSAMLPYVLMKGIADKLVDENAMAILSAPEQEDFFSSGH